MLKYYLGLLKLIIIISIFRPVLYAQSIDTTDNLNEVPKVFIDGNNIDMDHVRRKVQFVDYVIDRQEADIFILETRKRTGSGGREYTLTFFGRNKFIGITDTLVFNTLSTDTEDIIRDRFIKTLKIGLIPFMKDTPLLKYFNVNFEKNRKIEEVKDNWNYWVFRTRLRGNFEGEEFWYSYDIEGDIDADRITEEWKLRINAGINYDEENYNYPSEESFTSSSRRWLIRGLVVKSLSANWSFGGTIKSFSSTYNNIKFNYGIGPAIEYNIFPYNESTYREMRINYEVRFSHQFYNEKTIYDKIDEFLIQQSLEINLQIKQSWGDIELLTEYSNYLNDLTKNRLIFGGDISLNIFKGLALELGGGYSMIHDQISLPARDLDLDEILLKRNELATSYYFWFRYGISYTFGAIYNNIVNPRFN